MRSHAISSEEFEARWTQAMTEGCSFEQTIEFLQLTINSWIACDYANTGPEHMSYRLTVTGLEMAWLRSLSSVSDLFSCLRALSKEDRAQAEDVLQRWKDACLAGSS